VTRAAAVRLAPIAAALGRAAAPHAVVDLTAGGAAPDGPASAAVATAVDRALLRAGAGAVALVAGDGDAVVTAALTAARRGVPIARVGAGLRGGDRTVRAEINRLALDELAARLYVNDDLAAERLWHEGVARERIAVVGCTLADGILRLGPDAAERAMWDQLGVPANRYVLVALHQPENAGEDERVARITEALSALARREHVVLCLHPRLRETMAPMGDLERLRSAGARIVDGLTRVEFLSLLLRAGAVLTDSAALQEETTILRVPCFTFARASERTLTLTAGTNLLIGDDPADIAEVVVAPFAEAVEPIPLWDGAAGRRIAADLLERPELEA